MNQDKESLIALFIDYDNIAIGLKESGGKPFEVRRVLERLLEKGRIIYKRAYADWYLFSDGKQALHEHAIEMIDIPMRRNIGKNSADIRLVVDALDLCYTKEHIDTFVIGSGDSDFTPLVSKLKENDKHVIGFGLAQSTSNLLANNCDEFMFYEDLVSLPVNRPTLPVGLSKRQYDAFNLLLDAVAALMRENKDVLWGSLIKDTIRRKRPSFTESQYGYSTFSQLLEDAAKHQLVGLVKDPKSGGTPVVTGFGLAGDAAAGKPGAGTLAAPAPAKGPSLQVPPEGQKLPLANGDDKESKPRSTRSRRKPTTRKSAADKAKEEAQAAKEAPAADVKPDEKTDEEPKKKTTRRGTRRRSPAKPKAEATPAAEEQAPAETKDEKAKAESENGKPEAKKPGRRRSTSSKPKSAVEKKDEGEKASEPAAKSAEAPGDKAKPSRTPKAETKPVEEKKRDEKPKGQPLKSRVRRRRR